MYVGYVNRYEARREKRIWKIVGMVLVVLLAFLLGCAVMQLMLLVSKRNEPVKPENTYIAGEDSGVLAAGQMALGAESGIFGENANLQGTPENGASVSMGDAALSGEPADMSWVEPDTNLVVIDAGHGGEDEGCSNAEVLEKDINLTLALALRDKLEEMGFEVLLTREDDTYLSLEERVEIANASKGDFLISIHQNAYEEKQVRGIETWYNAQTAYGEESKRLAQLVQQRVILYTEAMDRGIVENEELVVVRETAMPSCLVETGFLSNSKERELLTDAAYQEQIVDGLAAAVELYFFPRTMYLTFDDGPSAENTNTILDTLKEQNVKATFFVIGENVRKHPEVAKRIVEEGHTIGIHCNWHDYDTLYESVDSYVADFEAAYQMVYEVTGVEAKIFRFPGGSINAYNEDVYEDIIEEMRSRGYVYFDWNASLEDAVGKTEQEKLLANARESTLGRKKIIMLAHDTVYNTALCLEDLIEQFPEYAFEPLTAEVEPIQFSANSQ